MLSYLLSSASLLMRGQGQLFSFYLFKIGTCFRSVFHTSCHSVCGTRWFIMAAASNLEWRSYLNQMSLYGERSRYLYSKMCCAGEWRNLWDSLSVWSVFSVVKPHSCYYRAIYRWCVQDKPLFLLES